MEIRKLIKSGQSSLIIVLPQKWVKDNTLKKGDSVYLDRVDNKIMISPFFKQSEESKFIIEKNRDNGRFLETLLYAGFLSDKKTIIINNITEKDFYELLKLLKKFHYLKLDEKEGNKVKLIFIVDTNLIDIEREVTKISRFFDIFFQLLIQKNCRKEDLEEAYDQISSQILFCMKVIKLKFLECNKNTVLRIKQQLDSYYFLLVTCRNLISQYKICSNMKNISSIIEKLRIKIKNLISLISEDNFTGVLNFWESNEKDKKNLLIICSNVKSIKIIQLFFMIYNAFITIENIAYSYINNH